MKPPYPFPEEWASDWGQDRHGFWMAFTFKGVRQEFRWIPQGSFLMGSPESEPERFKDEVLHEVTISKGFWLAETACKQSLWEAVMGENPSHFKGADLPVETVSWDDAMAFIDRLNAMKPELALKLPTEAQWEYACRAGTTTPFSFGNRITSDQVNFDGKNPYHKGKKSEFRKQTVDVKSLPGNPWGLFEMHGNVWELCSDWFGAYDLMATTDPQGPAEGSHRVLRGGAWDYNAWDARSASRFGYGPGGRSVNFGFRLARGREGEKSGEK